MLRTRGADSVREEGEQWRNIIAKYAKTQDTMRRCVFIAAGKVAGYAILPAGLIKSAIASVMRKRKELLMEKYECEICDDLGYFEEMCVYCGGQGCPICKAQGGFIRACECEKGKEYAEL
jgi:hypothetical protein